VYISLGCVFVVVVSFSLSLIDALDTLAVSHTQQLFFAVHCHSDVVV